MSEPKMMDDLFQLEGDNKQLLMENTELRKQITRLERQLEKETTTSQASFSPVPSNIGASDGTDSLRNRSNS